MIKIKITKREIEEEDIDYYTCDTCGKRMENVCGGVDFKLRDGNCSSCGCASWDFCCLKCLKEFVEKKALSSQINAKAGGLKNG